MKSAAATNVAVAVAGLAMACGLTACAVRVPRSVGITIPGPAGALAGSLVLPDGRGPYPAMVIVHAARRNGRLDYLQDARFYATRGIAVLTYDKRGTGGSAGDLSVANFEFLARDAMAAARALRSRPEIDSTRIGYLGVDQGGWIAPIAAALDSMSAFLVLVSAPVVSPLEQRAVARRAELVAKHVRPEDAEAITRLRARIWDYWISPQGSASASSDSLHKAFAGAQARAWFPAAVVSRDLPESLIVDEGMGADEHPARWWFRDDMPAFWSLRHDPAAVLRRVRAPILAVYGADDRTLPVAASLANLHAAAGARASVRTFEGADHDMLVWRGAGLLRKIGPAPGYRDAIVAWVKHVRGVPPRRGPPFRL